MARLDAGFESRGGRTKRKSVTFEDEIGTKKQRKSKRRKGTRNKTAVHEKDVFIKKIHARPIDGRYALINKLGQGGFGAVYVGACTTNLRPVVAFLTRFSKGYQQWRRCSVEVGAPVH